MRGDHNDEIAISTGRNQQKEHFLSSESVYVCSEGKKMEVAEALGLNEEEVDVYLGNHIKFTGVLDDIVQLDKLDPHRMQVAYDAGRYIHIPEEEGFIYDLWGMKYNVNDGGILIIAIR